MSYKFFAKFQEISFDVFLQVIWEDKRIKHKIETNESTQNFIELKVEERHKIWVSIHINQSLRESEALCRY